MISVLPSSDDFIKHSTKKHKIKKYIFQYFVEIFQKG